MLTLVFLDFKLDEMSVTQLKSNCVLPVKWCDEHERQGISWEDIWILMQGRKKEGGGVQCCTAITLKMM